MTARIDDVARLGLVMVDLQNDFLHPRGAYGRAGCTAPSIAALPAHIAPLAHTLRARGGWIVATQFTLVPGRNGEPFISPHLKALRPFLGKGDFAPGSFGIGLICIGLGEMKVFSRCHGSARLRYSAPSSPRYGGASARTGGSNFGSKEFRWLSAMSSG